jgi:hypothetical protein
MENGHNPSPWSKRVCILEIIPKRPSFPSPAVGEKQLSRGCARLSWGEKMDFCRSGKKPTEYQRIILPLPFTLPDGHLPVDFTARQNLAVRAISDELNREPEIAAQFGNVRKIFTG